MAHNPTWRPDSAKPFQSDAVPADAALEAAPLSSSLSDIENSTRTRGESDFAELAAKFAAHGGGMIPAELSGELALDIVLNEIVEQACQATGATGAAIALTRGDEMVCRASSGGSAPELGTRLDVNSGLSGACVRSRRIQACDDALADPSAEAEVSRHLGVRSVVVLPLLQGEELIGIFEVFSALPAAFGDHDLRTLEELAERILKNAQARRSSLISIGLAPTNFVAGTGHEDAGEEINAQTAAAVKTGDDTQVDDLMSVQFQPETTEVTSVGAPRFDWLTTVMAGIVVAVALLMGTVFAMRMGWLRASGPRRLPRATHASVSSTALTTQAIQPANAGSVQKPGLLPSGNMQNASTTPQSESRIGNGRVPEGSLRVYQNGREIYRMPPSENKGDDARPASKGANADARLESPRVVELSSEAAEGSLARRVEPEYPEQALTQRVQGPVLLDVRIGEDGAVQEIKLVSGSPLLAEAAVAAVRQWRFRPRTVSGRAVAMETRITLNFTLPPS